MKLLAFTDLHGNIHALAKIRKAVKKEKPDLILCAGDFTIFEHDLPRILKQLNSLQAEVLITHGNHEEEGTVRKACKKLPNVTFLHKEIIERQGYSFVTYGGGGFQERYADLEKWMKKKEFTKLHWRKTIVMTHTPPYGTELDNVSDPGETAWHVGSKTLLNLITKYQPVLVITGHIHECFNAKQQLKRTLLLNPGPFGKIVQFT